MLDRRVRLARALVVQHRVPVRERPTLGVLAREPDGNALGEQARESEGLRRPPIDPARPKHLAAALELREQLRVRLEALGKLEQLLVERLEPVGGYRGDDGPAGVRRDGGLLRDAWLRDRRLQP